MQRARESKLPSMHWRKAQTEKNQKIQTTINRTINQTTSREMETMATKNSSGNNSLPHRNRPAGTPNKAVKTGDATPIAGAVSGLLAETSSASGIPEKTQINKN